TQRVLPHAPFGCSPTPQANRIRPTDAPRSNYHRHRWKASIAISSLPSFGPCNIPVLHLDLIAGDRVEGDRLLFHFGLNHCRCLTCDPFHEPQHLRVVHHPFHPGLFSLTRDPFHLPRKPHIDRHGHIHLSHSQPSR